MPLPSLTNLGISLREVGLPHDALTALEEAVQLYRGLARREPDRHTPDLASSLNNLGLGLLQAGQRNEALDCRGEAVARWADLARRRPDDFHDGYQRQRADLARFCTEHGYPPGSALRAENDAAHRLGLQLPQPLVDLDHEPDE